MVLLALPTNVKEVANIFFDSFQNEPIAKCSHGVGRLVHSQAIIEAWKHNTLAYTGKYIDSQSGKILSMATHKIPLNLNANTR